MLNSIEIKNFKVHKKTELDLCPITILAGINGMGKSSIIQALLLMRQSMVNGDGRGLNLKGELYEAGTAYDVWSQEADSNTISFDLFSDEGIFRQLYEVRDGSDTYLSAHTKKPDSDFRNISLFTDDFQYISAFRFGPKLSYTRDTFVVKQHRQISKFFGRCEYAVHFLFEYGKAINVLPALKYPGTEYNQLEDQVQAWMEAVTPDIMIKILPHGDDLKLNYKYKREGNVPTREISAPNTGFGISYMLPLFVALLSARPGALIIIENPEAHVHPRAQAVFMKLVAKCAKAGIQIILETHSDHIINGAMVAVHDGYPVNDIAVYYIDRSTDEHAAVCARLDVRQNGRIMNPPAGFCDQIDIDLEQIIGL